MPFSTEHWTDLGAFTGEAPFAIADQELTLQSTGWRTTPGLRVGNSVPPMHHVGLEVSVNFLLNPKFIKCSPEYVVA